MIDSYAIVKQNGVYKVKVVTKETYLTDETEATWTITLKRNSRYNRCRGDCRYRTAVG